MPDIEYSRKKLEYYASSWSVSYLLACKLKEDTNQRCVKSIRVRSYSSPYLPALGLNVERYSFLNTLKIPFSLTF